MEGYGDEGRDRFDEGGVRVVLSLRHLHRPFEQPANIALVLNVGLCVPAQSVLFSVHVTALTAQTNHKDINLFGREGRVVIGSGEGVR